MEAFGIAILVIAGVIALFLIVKGARNAEKMNIIAGIILIFGAILIALFCFEKEKELDDLYNMANRDSVTQSSYGKNSSSGSFSNKYGTRTTKCAVSGCDSYIARSGDTNCCVYHSNKCGNCRCYIDSDAMYCMSCISGALNDNKSSDHECYICGEKAYSKYGSYYYCSDCKELVKAFSQ